MQVFFGGGGGGEHDLSKNFWGIQNNLKIHDSSCVQPSHVVLRIK